MVEGFLTPRARFAAIALERKNHECTIDRVVVALLVLERGIGETQSFAVCGLIIFQRLLGIATLTPAEPLTLEAAGQSSEQIRRFICVLRKKIECFLAPADAFERERQVDLGGGIQAAPILRIAEFIDG